MAVALTLIAVANRCGSVFALTPYIHRQTISIRNYGLALNQFPNTVNDISAVDGTKTVNGRISCGLISSPSLSIIENNIEMVLSHLRSRRCSESTLDAVFRVASLSKVRVNLIQVRDEALRSRNEASAIVRKILLETKEQTEDENIVKNKLRSKRASKCAMIVDTKLEELESTLSSLLSTIPNFLDDVVPDGEDSLQNEEISVWGSPLELSQKLGWPSLFKPKWHDQVASSIGGWKTDDAVSMSGSRFVALSGKVARLQRAISSFFIDIHTMRHGYTEISVPYVVGRSALEGTCQLPKFEKDLFKISSKFHRCNGEEAFLIPTAEVPLTNMYAGKILDESDLPISCVAYTPCFRSEVGSYGRDTRGLIRNHQFHKVELVKITSQRMSDLELEKVTEHAQTCLEYLGLPYRKVRLCSGDIGFSARHCYDLEVWLPASGEYREISSCSNNGDFQARRMGIRYRPKDKKESEAIIHTPKYIRRKRKKIKPLLCHTINGSGLAVERTLCAVLENYQLIDGCVMVPKVLRPYLGGEKILTCHR